ncbi:hypothetical protein [Caulobacter sp. FWC26]|uniref:hypothetical protein n=1 Tax=Caulobacter sp. FWC26 TaxID=69665 RepID=UPI000C14666A|nr:hypothetical protein [Caulobacter sp. FWC26]AZS19402.1 hypothetical protein CSW63_01375 [Caulobacter sp. FWC26]
MSNTASQDQPERALKLHPDLEAFLNARCAKSGRSREGEIACLIGEAMAAAEIPPAPTSSPFQCSQELMAEKAECQDCGERILHNAKLWAERHVQLTGHRVAVSLHYDLRDEDWQAKLTPERRAEIDSARDGDTARALAASLLKRSKH